MIFFVFYNFICVQKLQIHHQKRLSQLDDKCEQLGPDKPFSPGVVLERIEEVENIEHMDQSNVSLCLKCKLTQNLYSCYLFGKSRLSLKYTWMLEGVSSAKLLR